MLTPEEEKFFRYWQAQREHKKGFLRKLSIGLPLGVGLALLLLVNLLSGWYRRATAELNSDGSLLIVILVALVGIVLFITIFSAHHRWDRNEAAFQDLLRKKETAAPAQQSTENKSLKQ